MPCENFKSFGAQIASFSIFGDNTRYKKKKKNTKPKYYLGSITYLQMYIKTGEIILFPKRFWVERNKNGICILKTTYIFRYARNPNRTKSFVKTRRFQKVNESTWRRHRRHMLHRLVVHKYTYNYTTRHGPRETAWDAQQCVVRRVNTTSLYVNFTTALYFF